MENQKEFSNRPLKKFLKNSHGYSKQPDPSPLPSSATLNQEIGGKTDEDIFKKAMEGVILLNDGKRKIMKSPQAADPSSLKSNLYSTGDQGDLSWLLRQPGALDISFSDEYTEGKASGVSLKIMKRLRRGELSVQDHIDLHGLRKKQAEATVTEFLVRSFQRGLRCVLVIHGRGLRSMDGQATIKSELPFWLKKGALKKIVLAFTTARPFDGGTGASYVLLKKR